MIRRHLTPALVAFTALLLSCLASPLLGSRWWCAAALSLLSAAAGTTVLAPRGAACPAKAWRRAGLLLLGISAGLILGAASQARMSLASARSFLPMAGSDVTAITATVVQDSSLSQNGDTVVRLAMSEASSGRKGITAGARGGVLLFVDGDSRFSIGQRVIVQASPSPMAGPGPERWVARAPRAEVATLGFAGPVWRFRSEAREWLHRSVSRVRLPGVRSPGGAAHRRAGGRARRPLRWLHAHGEPAHPCSVRSPRHGALRRRGRGFSGSCGRSGRGSSPRHWSSFSTSSSRGSCRPSCAPR